MFQLETAFTPCADQPQAIEALTNGLLAGKHSQVLLGITGSGKTFTIANVIARVQKPTLVIAHNKTLAAQLYQEFRTFFPNNAVEYFVSYYDYYQPEAYIPRTDTYIEKDFAINDKIDKMRLSATRSLLERDDVIIIASVSCIYGLGSPAHYKGMTLSLTANTPCRRDDLLLHLVEMQYQRNDSAFTRATFRVRGDTIDIFPAYEEDKAIRVELDGDTISALSEFDPLTGKPLRSMPSISIYPSSHHVTPEAIRYEAIESIRAELQERCALLESQGRITEMERLRQRTLYDIEMLREMGFCKGIENYSRHFSHRQPGEPPPCLLDYFPKDFLLVVDESHQTIPQLRAMCHGDRSRKQALVEYGFRLPSAFDNRPLTFDETYSNVHDVIYVSATPSEWEVHEAGGTIVEQVIRPTGILDPRIEVRAATTQVDNVMAEIHREIALGGRVLVTTLTKKLSEELTTYLTDLGVKTRYLHSDVDTLERIEIIANLRRGIFDVLVGINLLREGLDLPEVTLVAILDADKEGFLRSTTSLIQTCGRAARNASGRVIMYADKPTLSITETIAVVERRRAIQQTYNEAHGITPTTVRRKIELLPIMEEDMVEMAAVEGVALQEALEAPLSLEEIRKRIKACDRRMRTAAKELQFDEAAKARDELRRYQQLELRLA